MIPSPTFSDTEDDRVYMMASAGAQNIMPGPTSINGFQVADVVRKFFPEVWLWHMVDVDAEYVVDSSHTQIYYY